MEKGVLLRQKKPIFEREFYFQKKEFHLEKGVLLRQKEPIFEREFYFKKKEFHLEKGVLLRQKKPIFEREFYFQKKEFHLEKGVLLRQKEPIFERESYFRLTCSGAWEPSFFCLTMGGCSLCYEPLPIYPRSNHEFRQMPNTHGYRTF